MANFFSRLSYSFGNEDWRSEQQALKIKPNDRVLAVTGSGDRPLHHLIDSPAEVVAIDANVIQNHLLTLKCSAMKQLSYDDYLSLLTGKSGNKIFCDLALPPDTAAFWNRHRRMIKKGVLYQGATEKMLRLASKIVRILRRRKIRQLFLFENLEEQIAFVDHHWNTLFWKKGFELIFFLATIFLRGSGMKHVAPSVNPGTHHLDRMTHSLHQTLAKDNFFLSLIFQGKVHPNIYPPYLSQTGISQIKPKLDRLTTHTSDLIDYLEAAPPQSFNAFSLSDVASYIDYSAFTRLTKAIIRTAKPGARFCMRQYLTRHSIPTELGSHFQRDKILEEQLTDQDHSLFYKFMVGTIQ